MMRLPATPDPARGFSLVELLLVLALVATLGALAAHPLQQWADRALLEAELNRWLRSAQQARQLALQHGHAVEMRTLPDQTWNHGWELVRLPDQALLARQPAAPHRVQIQAPASDHGSANTLAAGYLLFQADGFPRTRQGGLANGSLHFGIGAHRRSAVLHQAGRLRVCDPARAACP